tara:strand:+ start:123 stop:533 length:411 start_codon:yes stop_codon:yes gene_type:complete
MANLSKNAYAAVKKVIPIENHHLPAVKTLLSAPIKRNHASKLHRPSQQCWTNAWMEHALHTNSSLMVGVVFQKIGECGMLPIPHAWVEDHGGNIVETTAGIDGPRVYIGVGVINGVYEKMLYSCKNIFDEMFLKPQ